MPDSSQSLYRLLVALLVGLLIGLDRERAEDRKQRKLFAGIRTFALIALLAACLSLTLPLAGPWPLLVGFAAVALIAFHSYRLGAQDGHVGATTEIAALGTYALGVLAGLGQVLVAAAAAVAVAVLLAAKPPLERLSRALSEAETTAVLELAVISAIVWPLLPDQGYGPWEVLNPSKIWLVVVLVSAVSFVGFLASRWKGEAGLLWAAALGALVSSTAVTMAMAQRSKQQPDQARAAAAAAVIASTVMAMRLLVLVGVIRPSLLVSLAPAVGAMALVGVSIALLLRRGTTEAAHAHRGAHVDARRTGADRPGAKGDGPVETGDRRPGNPFSLRAALVFGALFAGALLLVRGSQELFGGGGTLLAAVITGFVDVDAISIAIARGVEVDARATAALGIVVACASNNLFKSGVAVVAGAGSFRRDVPLALVSMSATAAAVLLVGRLW